MKKKSFFFSLCCLILFSSCQKEKSLNCIRGRITESGTNKAIAGVKVILFMGYRSLQDSYITQSDTAITGKDGTYLILYPYGVGYLELEIETDHYFPYEKVQGIANNSVCNIVLKPH